MLFILESVRREEECSDFPENSQPAATSRYGIHAERALEHREEFKNHGVFKPPF